MSRAGFVLGPLVVGTMRHPSDKGLVAPVRTWANGLLHRGVTFNVTPWRDPKPGRYGVAPIGLVLAWRL
ncbi:hypothetical protein PMNALOAF_2742 [Methylobacterium adhaesivum]|uniref:Uncharacterized protein n=1 Tax=Methylobacterium adhaesivum TaxID=333297 RepID=A0ABT8BLC5_9HYPH|nr:hypothetical protein [Methylobacterium adhaesivum]MDN3592095.1 hypothetical protein [Methylobacterium adhaesivum]GJD31483.1 hypothetical protein PMNALOAF_2742 [Methylobacterium adhaesivum]